MGAIFQSLGRTILAGFIILVVLIVATGGAGARGGDHAWFAFLFRWLHVMAGVMWIGLLWYFNFVQIPSMAKIPDEQKPAIGKVIAPTALFWFGQMMNHTLKAMIRASHMPMPIAVNGLPNISAVPR